MKKNPILFDKKFTGAHLVKTESSSFLLGTRTGIHQDIMAANSNSSEKISMPSTVFLSDLTIKSRVSCLDLEFVFLASLFLGVDFASGKTSSDLFDFKERKVLKKFKVILDEGEDYVAWDQLAPSLLGASRGFLKNTCRLNKTLWTMLTSEAHFFNLKDSDGNEFKIEDFVEVGYWDDNNKYRFDDNLVVEKMETLGHFSVITSEGKKEVPVLETCVDFENDEVGPVWDIPETKKPFSYADLSVTPLGTSSPFNPNEPPTCYWLKLGTKENYLIDCGFFTDLIFEKNGGNLDDLRGIILTHCHGDHFNPIPFLYRGKPLELWTTLENYKLAQKITCAKSKITAEQFQARFKFRPVEAMYPGFEAPKYRFGILDIEFHYSIHPIPTIGLSIYHEDKKLIVFSSDMVDLNFIQETMYEKEIINKDRHDMIMERFSQENHPETLFLLDCGGDGFIHGKPGGYSKFFHDTTKIVECHRGSRKSGESSSMQLAEPLSLIQILSYSNDARMTSMLCQMLSDLNVDYVVDWATKLREGIDSLEFSANQPIIAYGNQVSKKMYLIDYGNLKSSTGFVYSTGMWFGEESLLGHEIYQQSIHTMSPVRLFVIDVSVLENILSDETESSAKLMQEIMQKHDYRRALGAAKLFSELSIPVSTIDELAINLTVEKYRTGDFIYKKNQIDDGHMFIVKEGKVTVKLSKSKHIEQGENDIIGERVASGVGIKRNADVVAATPATLLKISHDDFSKLLEDARIYNRIMEINKQRS